MRARIASHRQRRGADWINVEAPHELPSAIRAAAVDRPVLVDCLTLWLTNLMLSDADLPKARAELVEALQARTALTVVVSNEVGLGIVPDNALARRFRDEAGVLHQEVARIAGEAHMIVAGLSIRAK